MEASQVRKICMDPNQQKPLHNLRDFTIDPMKSPKNYNEAMKHPDMEERGGKRRSL